MTLSVSLVLHWEGASAFWVIRYIGVSGSTTIYASYPIYTMGLAILFLKESVSVALVIGVLLIIGGLALLLSEREGEKIAVKGANKLLGFVFSMASAISYGANSVLIKGVVSNRVNPLVTATMGLLFGALMLSIFSGRHVITSMRSNLRSTCFLILSGFSMTVGAMANYSALSLIPAVVASPLGAKNPLFAILGTYIFLKKFERITYQVVLGSLMAVGGSVLVTLG